MIYSDYVLQLNIAVLMEQITATNYWLNNGTYTWLTNRILIKNYKIHMRIQSVHTYKVLQHMKHVNAYTIILIYNINQDGVE